MDYLLFGIQGSGKGTQGKFLAEKVGLSVFETGAVLRKLGQEESPLSDKVKKIIDAGELVPDEIIMESVAAFLDKLPENTNVLFDGIPRTLNQNKLLTELLASRNRNYKAVLINIDESEALKRLTTRKICNQCQTAFPATYNEKTCNECGGELIARADDNLESIKKRLQNYSEQTLPVIETYRKSDNLVDVNGKQTIAAVTEELFAKIAL